MAYYLCFSVSTHYDLYIVYTSTLWFAASRGVFLLVLPLYLLIVLKILLYVCGASGLLKSFGATSRGVAGLFHRSLGDLCRDKTENKNTEPQCKTKGGKPRELEIGASHSIPSGRITFHMLQALQPVELYHE